jgi:hypothetical protein
VTRRVCLDCCRPVATHPYRHLFQRPPHKQSTPHHRHFDGARIDPKRPAPQRLPQPGGVGEVLRLIGGEPAVEGVVAVGAQALVAGGFGGVGVGVGAGGGGNVCMVLIDMSVRLRRVRCARCGICTTTHPATDRPNQPNLPTHQPTKSPNPPDAHLHRQLDQQQEGDGQGQVGPGVDARDDDLCMLGGTCVRVACVCACGQCVYRGACRVGCL